MRRKAHNFLRKQKIEPERYVVLVLRHIAFAQPCENKLSSDPYGATSFQKEAIDVAAPRDLIKMRPKAATGQAFLFLRKVARSAGR